MIIVTGILSAVWGSTRAVAPAGSAAAGTSMGASSSSPSDSILWVVSKVEGCGLKKRVGVERSKRIWQPLSTQVNETCLLIIMMAATLIDNTKI